MAEWRAVMCVFVCVERAEEEKAEQSSASDGERGVGRGTGRTR